MAVLRVASISCDGELGEVRANENQLGWRGASGAMVVVELSSVTSAELLQGRLSITHSHHDGAVQNLTLEGFGDDHWEAISAHFEQHAQIFLSRGAQKSLPTLLTSTVTAENEAIKPQFAVEKSSVETGVAPDGIDPRTQRPWSAQEVEQLFQSLQDTTDVGQWAYFLSAKNAVYGTSLFEGHVWKQSAWVKKWERRYLVLSTTGLFSYKARAEITPSVVFGNIVACSASEDRVGSKCFCVQTREGLIVKKHFITTENDAERDQWVSKINEVLLRRQH